MNKGRLPCHNLGQLVLGKRVFQAFLHFKYRPRTTTPLVSFARVVRIPPCVLLMSVIALGTGHVSIFVYNVLKDKYFSLIKISESDISFREKMIWRVDRGSDCREFLKQPCTIYRSMGTQVQVF